MVARGSGFTSSPRVSPSRLVGRAGPCALAALPQHHAGACCALMCEVSTLFSSHLPCAQRQASPSAFGQGPLDECVPAGSLDPMPLIAQACS